MKLSAGQSPFEASNLLRKNRRLLRLLTWSSERSLNPEVKHTTLSSSTAAFVIHIMAELIQVQFHCED